MRIDSILQLLTENKLGFYPYHKTEITCQLYETV